MFQPKTIKRTHGGDEADQQRREGFSFQPQPEDLSEKKIRLNSNVHLEGLVTPSNRPQYTDTYTTQYITDKSKNLNLIGRMGQRSASTEEEFPSHDSDNQDDCVVGSSVMSSYDSMTKHDYEVEEARQLETLEIFAKDFKQKRIKLGYTQGDVGLAIGQLSGNDFSQTTISRFEALNLSFKNMCKLRPLLEKWLNYANKMVKKAEGGEMVEVPMDPSITPGRKRKKRTSIDQKRRGVLDDMFNKNPKPTSDELHNIAEECCLDKEVVRVWFCNRRQKEKRIAMHEQQTKEDVDSHSPPDSPRATMYPPSRIVPDTQGNFASFVSSATSSNINNLSRAGPSSLLGEAQVAGGQKHQDRSQEQNLHPFRLAGFPILPHGNQLSQVRGLDPAFLFRSAEAVRNSSHVSPAYSALHQEQYRKNLVSSAALQSNTSSLLSSFSSPSSLANHSNPDKATMSSASRLPSSVAHPDVRNTSTSNASAVLSTTY